MSLIYIQGFDGGVPCLGAGCYPWQTTTFGTAISTVTSPARTGGRSLRINPTGANTAALGVGTYDPTTGGGGVGLTLTEFWGRFYFQYATKSSAAGGEQMTVFRTAGNVSAGIILLLSSGKIRVTGSGVGSADGTTVLAANTWYEIETHYLAGAAGQLEVKLNGVVEVTLNASFNVNAIADFLLGKRSDTNSTNIDYFYDDFVISNSAYPGPGKVLDLRPAAAGTYSDWASGPVPQDFSQVNVSPVSMTAGVANYIENSGGAANQVSTFIVDNPITAGITGKVKAVLPWIIAREEASVVSDQKIRFRVNGVNQDILSFNTNTTYQNQGKLYVTNPNTGLNWKRADLINAEVGPLQANAVQIRCTATGITVAFNDEEPGDGQPLISLLGAGS